MRSTHKRVDPKSKRSKKSPLLRVRSWDKEVRDRRSKPRLVLPQTVTFFATFNSKIENSKPSASAQDPQDELSKVRLSENQYTRRWAASEVAAGLS